MRGVVAVVTILAALTAAGCGGGDEAAVAPVAGDAPDRFVEAIRPVRAPAVPAGFRVRRVPEAGLQLAVPRGWVALGRRDAAFPGTAQTLIRIDRGVAGALAALMVPDSPLKLLVLVPGRSGKGFGGTVSLIVTPLREAPPSFDGWADATARVLVEGADVRGEVSTRRVRLPVGDAVRLAFERTRAGKPVAMVELAALAGDRMVLLALTTTPARARELTPRFDALASTLSLLGGVAPAPTTGIAQVG
jgi:hypothetical protein